MAGALFTAALVATSMLPAGAQVPDTSALRTSTAGSDSAVVERGDSLHRALEPRAALRAFTDAIPDTGGAHSLLWRAARESVHLGMLAEEDDVRRERFTEAVNWAERAVAADSTAAEGGTWLAIVRGRRALLEGLQTRIRLVNGVRTAANRALALDSTSAGGHHVLGQWHAEVKRLNTLERLAAGAIGAEAFGDASWDRALQHLETAVRLEPEALIHRLALARVYADLDRDAEARTQAREVLDLPVREPTDPLHREGARDLLDELGNGS